MKRIIILAILLGIGLVAWYFISQSRWGSMRGELKDFAVKDTSGITKIFLADRGGESALLEKQEDGRWKVNSKFYADDKKVANLLEVIKLIDVKSPVPEKDKKEVLADMAAHNTKVEIFKGDRLVKTYMVGDNTQDELGTYMLMENSNAPFITHIPGFQGFLTARYFVKEKEWKTSEIFSYQPEDLKSISVEYPASPADSYILTTEGGKTTIRPLHPELAPSGIPDTSLLKFYKGYFKAVHYEGHERNILQSFTDSFYKASPFAIVKTEGHNGRNEVLKIYRKPIDIRTKVETDLQGNLLEYDIERYYAFHNNEKDLLIIQDFVFKNILRRYSDFLKPQGKPAITN